jgi:putative hydrolase of the HAD superfamily
LFEFFARAEAWKLYPETIEILEQLKKRGLILGVISNFDSRLFGLLDGLGIAHFFDLVVISTQVGAAKPEAAIFTRFARTGGPPRLSTSATVTTQKLPEHERRDSRRS